MRKPSVRVEACIEAVYDRHKLSRETGHYEALFGITLICRNIDIVELETLLEKLVNAEKIHGLILALEKHGKAKLIIGDPRIVEELVNRFSSGRHETINIPIDHYYYVLSLTRTTD